MRMRAVFDKSCRRLPKRHLGCGSRHCFSSTTADDAADPSKLTQHTATLHPRSTPLFPWRHEADLLPRLVPGTPEFIADVVLPENGQCLMASVFLQLSFLQAFVLQGWKTELAESSAYAFSQGVAGLISNTYQLPVDTVSKQDAVHFHYPPQNKENDTTTINNENKDDVSSQEASPDDDGGGGDHEITQNQQLQSMLDEKLVKLYESAHKSGREQLQIQLQMEPTRYTFMDFFALPFVTRELVERNPAVLSNMQEHLRMMQQSPAQGFQRFSEYVQEQADKNNDSLFTTLDLQILVEADEIFRVVDKTTGKVVQGSEDGLKQKVVHLIRLETTVETIPEDAFPYIPTHRRDNWKIVDIDDLLGTPAWYSGLRRAKADDGSR